MPTKVNLKETLNQAQAGSSWRRLLNPIFLCLCSLLLLALAAFIIWQDTKIIGNLDECWIFDTILRLKRGQPLYYPHNSYPYNIPCIYTPLYHIVCSWLLPLCPQTIFLPELVSSIAYFGVWLVFFFLLRKQGLGQSAGLLLLFTWASSWDLVANASFCRPDMSGFLFCSVGLLFFVYRPFSAWPWVFYWLALACRQTFLAAPLASLLFLFSQNRQVALKRAAAFAFSCVLGLGLLQLYSHGQAMPVFLKLGGAINPSVGGNTFRPMQAGDLLQFFRGFRQSSFFFFFKTWPKVYWLPVGALIWVLWQGITKGSKGNFYFYFAAASLVCNWPLLLRQGGGPQYLLEFSLASALCLGSVWQQVFAQPDKLIKTLLILGVLFHALTNSFRCATLNETVLVPLDVRSPDRLVLAEKLKVYSGPIYVSDPYQAFYSCHELLFYHKTSENLAQLQAWLRQGRFQALSLRDDDPVKSFLAVKANYSFTQRIGLFEIWVRKTQIGLAFNVTRPQKRS